MDFIGEFLQSNVKNRSFCKLDSKYGGYFPDYAYYFGRPLRLKKSMYGMNNYGYLFADELTNWLINETGFNHSKYQMYVYYKYAPDGSKLVVLSYVNEGVYRHIPKELVKWVVDTLGKDYMWTS